MISSYLKWVDRKVNKKRRYFDASGEVGRNAFLASLLSLWPLIIIVVAGLFILKPSANQIFITAFTLVVLIFIVCLAYIIKYTKKQ